MQTFPWAWDPTAPSCTDFPETMADNSIISALPIFAHHPPEHLAFTQGPLQASAPAGLTFHASCTQGNAAPACPACAVFPDEAQQGEKPAGLTLWASPVVILVPYSGAKLDSAVTWG